MNTRFYLVLWSAYMSRDFDSLKSFHLLAECLSYGIAALISILIKQLLVVE